jgi:DNA-binding SARP family transcriptional activator
MLRVNTLGGLTLAVEDVPVTGVLTQRRRLALLALLAAARDRGVSRDKLVAYLWPESPAPDAHHALAQLLYAQRKAFAPHELFLGRKTVRLNPAVARSDVWEFENALDRGALAEAVAHYGGPFLDGFFLRGAPEFERWVDAQRDRLAGRMRAACIQLARAARAADDRAAAADWWQRAAAVDPLDSHVAAEVVKELEGLGNRSAALAHAEAHVQRLRRELGVGPDSQLLALIDRLRKGDPPALAS